MRKIDLNRGWSFQNGLYNHTMALTGQAEMKEVNLPHDYMLESNVTEDAPASLAMGYYDGTVGSYTKTLDIPSQWKDDKIYLHFDGVMQNATVEINGSVAALHHYGYTPFQVDITPYVYYGESNRLTVTTNASMQPNSRWYTGAGIYRTVDLVHTPRLHVKANGIFTYTKRIEYHNQIPTEAYIAAEVTVMNDTLEDHLVKVVASLTADNPETNTITRSTSVLVKAGSEALAVLPITVKNPMLWDAEQPHLYLVKAQIEDMGVFRTRQCPVEGAPMTDSDTVLFGIRTVTADSTHGLLINGKEVKLKGGCIHHDNGILGAVSLYDSEYRKLKKHKEGGYNAVRLAHNPPSAVLLEACDRLGLYVFNEAFDAWGMAKQPGDYNQHFHKHWQEDMSAFILRDRNHPSILFWSTGNEIPERGGLSDGYTLSAKLAEYVRSLDSTRLITNGMCTYWSGLDDKTMLENLEQMSDANDKKDTSWEERSEAFIGPLDVVGYNYMEDHYEIAGELYPERVIVGTESFPMQIDYIWDLVERLPYVIGDFTWTSYDYIGEAGIGKSLFVEPDSTETEAPSHSSQYPWRLANDADYDINGNLMPQGSYRRIVWGCQETSLFSYDPECFGKTELISRWGWPGVRANWNFVGFEGSPVQVVVYSAAEEVELLLNDQSLGKQAAGKANRYTASFSITYEPGLLEAISYHNGVQISRTSLQTPGAPASIRLCAEHTTLLADGNSLAYVSVEIVDADGNLVTDAALPLTATVQGTATLAGFGSANPITEENYTAGSFTSYRGQAMAVIRSGYEAENAVLTVSCENMEDATIIFTIK